MKTSSSHLTAEQVQATLERSGLTRQEFAARVGCGTSQLFKYEKEGLPPRMNREVQANLLRLAIEHGVIPQNAGQRAKINKLSKSRNTLRGRNDSEV
ncbi:MAG: helix-turn-helix domain-containing protein [Abitibacteriaceae bacterium]|nr:helix-turn-helix domain-containing protein [Abditibacteriaceae bacterium]MBV9867439.1 helix-turn-helix domain-containing protein [Abditibacteriaceae bacterium]